MSVLHDCSSTTEERLRHALLKSQGMSQPLLRTVFRATALAKLLYCSSVGGDLPGCATEIGWRLSAQGHKSRILRRE